MIWDPGGARMGVLTHSMVTSQDYEEAINWYQLSKLIVMPHTTLILGDEYLKQWDMVKNLLIFEVQEPCLRSNYTILYYDIVRTWLLDIPVTQTVPSGK